jgi:hypothetical protein
MTETKERASIANEIDMIEVRRTAEHDSFEVVIREGKGESRHHVTMSPEMCERLTAGKHKPERCLEAAFRFLLDREPKGIDPWMLRRDRDPAILPRVRAGDATLPFTVLTNKKWRCLRRCGRSLPDRAAVLTHARLPMSFPALQAGALGRDGNADSGVRATLKSQLTSEPHTEGSVFSRKGVNQPQ